MSYKELSCAIEEHDMKKVEALLSNGADPNANLEEGELEWGHIGTAIEELKYRCNRVTPESWCRPECF